MLKTPFSLELFFDSDPSRVSSLSIFFLAFFIAEVNTEKGVSKEHLLRMTIADDAPIRIFLNLSMHGHVRRVSRTETVQRNRVETDFQWLREKKTFSTTRN